ncbi:MAG: radical SAM protein, partial [Candidatus Omnitrophica bacterium]|nr:radical SAM protein [Candidatus Omnitrophota bacterium]
AKTVKSLIRMKKEGMLFSSRSDNESPLRRRITDLTLNIVKGCNLRCRYCWNQFGAYKENSSGDISRMNTDVAFKAVDLLLKESHGSRDVVVDFYGGEPLLNFGLIKEVIRYCGDKQKKRGINFRFLLATNGTLLDKEKGEFLIGNGVDVALSLDGSREIQDTQRPFPGNKGSFGRIMKNLSLLKKGYRERLVGRATFTPYSQDIIKTFKFLRSMGFERIEVCESEQAGYGLQSKNRFFFTGESGLRRLKVLYNDLAAFYADEVMKGRLNYENTYFNRFFKQLSRLYHIQSVTGTCSAGFSLMAVDMDGGIYPCTAFVGISRFMIGDTVSGINEKKLSDFLNTKISSSHDCKICWAKRICRGCGSCYNLNYFASRKANRPDPYYCDLFRYKTQLMMAMIATIGEKDPNRLEDVLIPEYYAARGRRKRKATP